MIKRPLYFVGLEFLRRMLAAAALAALAVPVIAAELPEPAALRARIAAGEHAQVFAELAPLEFEFAGRPQYDYLFATAALRSGEINVAAFVLERVVAVEPSHIGAAFELAQTDILLGKIKQGLAALRELAARADVPPEQKRMIVGRIIGVEAALQARARAAYLKQFGWSGSVALGGGYTNNARFAPGDSDLILRFENAPGFEFRPEGEDPESSAYAETAAQLEYQMPRGESGRWTFGLNAFSRDYEGESGANDSNYRAVGPYFSASTIAAGVQVDGRLSAERVAVADDWRHDVYSSEIAALTPLSETAALRAALGYRHLRGQDGEADDKNTRLANVALIWAPRRDAVVRLQAGVASENRKDDGDSDGDKIANSIQTAASFGLTDAVSATILASFRKARYERPAPAFPDALRRDYTTTAALSLRWKITDDLAALPEFILTRARSTISDYAFVRREYRFGLRYEF